MDGRDTRPTDEQDRERRSPIGLQHAAVHVGAPLAGEARAEAGASKEMATAARCRQGGVVDAVFHLAQPLMLMREGDALYGVSQHRGSGYTIQISVERDSGTFASPRPQNDKSEGH